MISRVVLRAPAGPRRDRERELVIGALVRCRPVLAGQYAVVVRVDRSGGEEVCRVSGRGSAVLTGLRSLRGRDVSLRVVARSAGLEIPDLAA